MVTVRVCSKLKNNLKIGCFTNKFGMNSRYRVGVLIKPLFLSRLWIWDDYSQRSAELAIIILYPTSASGIIVLLKTPTKYREFFPTLFVNKTTDFQLVFNFEQTRTVTIFGEHGIMAHIPWWLSQSELCVYFIYWQSSCSLLDVVQNLPIDFGAKKAHILSHLWFWPKW